MIDSFWKDKRVLVTGHTGFKGSWLCLWLQAMGAEVTGFALPASTNPNMYGLVGIDKLITRSYLADIRDYKAIYDAISESKPEIIFHLAAQPLVRDSYKLPVETYATNVMGTVHLLEAIRQTGSVKAVLNITTDKCYENNEWHWGYRENDRLGGHDPYSNSKACSELVTSAFRTSFFNTSSDGNNITSVASARAGNVIGGGDWASDRLIPDCINALLHGEKVTIRNPSAIRPWQHVLEPLRGYLMLAERLFINGNEYAESWNFGPDDSDAQPVIWIVKNLCEKLNIENGFVLDQSIQPHEAKYLKLDCSKSKDRLGWKPKWNLDTALEKIIEWYQAYQNNEDMLALTQRQIKEFSESKEKG